MANLIAKSAAHGLLPQTISAMTLLERTPQITSVAPFKGQQKAVGEALGGWPAPNRSKGNVLWSGRGQAFVIGECVDVTGMAATTDQTDAWAALTLEGKDLEAVLARLTPLDVGTMKRGHTARSLLGHMNALYHRTGAETMDIYVFRSMAKTAVHDITHAMTSVAARASN